MNACAGIAHHALPLDRPHRCRRRTALHLQRLSRETSMYVPRLPKLPFRLFSRYCLYWLFTYVSSSGSWGGPGGALGVGLGGGAFGRGGATRPGGAAGAIAKSFSSAPHFTHFFASGRFTAPHLGHLISFLPAEGGLKHIVFLLLITFHQLINPSSI